MNYNKKTVEDIAVSGKKVLVRCDFNVPMDGQTITDDKRIVAALPTIKYLIDNNAKVILCSHLGRPKGEFNPKYTLAPIAARLSELLGKPVPLAADVIGDDARAKAAASKDGDVMLIETSASTRKKRRTTRNFQSSSPPRRDICKRRVRHRSPRSFLDRRRRRLSPRSMRISDPERDQDNGRRARRAEAPSSSPFRRRQSLRQDRRYQ